MTGPTRVDYKLLAEQLRPMAITVAAMLGTLQTNDPLFVAVRAAVEVGEGRRLLDVWAGCPECERREAMLRGGPPALLKHRYPPTGDWRTWVRYGPAGPPELREGPVA